MKLLKGKAPEPKTEGRLVALPVKLCEPHPDLQTRLKYDQVDALAKDIRVHGQLQPGRAVDRPDGTGYWVYMGMGRLLAVKKLFDKDGEPKSYYALLDEGLPFVELFSRSMSENLKRRNLSVLEEVRSYYLASLKASEDEIVAASSKIGEEPGMVRKRIELAAVLGGKLAKLYEVETRARTGFSFQIGHLEALAKLTQEKAFYEAATAAAVAGFSVKELQSSLKNNSIDKVVSGLPEWFYEVFPEYAMVEEEKRSLPADVEVVAAPPPTDRDPPSPSGLPLPEPTSPTPKPAGPKAEVSTAGRGPSHPPSGIVLKESQPFVACPRCGAQTPFNLKEDSEITVVRFKGSAVPEKDSVAPEGSYRRLCNCVNPSCREEFWLWASRVDGELRVEGRRKEDGEGWFSLPEGNPTVGAVSWSAERKSWVVKAKASGKEYLYGEDGLFTEA